MFVILFRPETVVPVSDICFDSPLFFCVWLNIENEVNVYGVRADAGHRERAGADVRKVGTGLYRHAADIAAKIGAAAHGAHGRFRIGNVRPGAAGGIRGDVGIDELRVARLDGLIGDSERLYLGGGAVMYEYVRFLYELPENILALGGLDVDGYALLVEVVDESVGA